MRRQDPIHGFTGKGTIKVSYPRLRGCECVRIEFPDKSSATAPKDQEQAIIDEWKRANRLAKVTQ